MVVGAFAAITGAVAAHTEAVIKNNNATIEAENKTLEEKDKNEQLYKSYNDLYNQYEQGKIKKEGLKDVTDNLIGLLKKERVEVAKLTGDYASLNEEITRARKEATEEALKSANNKLASASSNVETKSRENDGRKSGDSYKLNLSEGMSYGDEEEI